MNRGTAQFAVGLNPGMQAIEFSILNYNGELQTLSWEKPEDCNCLNIKKSYTASIR